MKFTLYKNADDFLEDSRQFICDNSLEADLIYMNAHSSLTKEQGFYGASVKDGDEIMLSIQTGNYPRVHFSNCKNPKKMTDVLAENYAKSNSIPEFINGDTKSVKTLIESLKKYSAEYTLHMDMLKRKCIKLIDIPVLPLKIVNAKTVDFDFTDYYIQFSIECNLTSDIDKAKEKTDNMIAKDSLYAIIDKENVVAIAATARKTENGRAINMVYTPPEYRGMGYSTCCVKQLTAKILSEHDYAFLYTDRSNPISNHVYEKLGYNVFAEFCQFNKVSI